MYNNTIVSIYVRVCIFFFYILYILQLTNLLLHGCNPLLKCQNGDDIYENIFMLIKQILLDMENIQTKSAALPSKIINHTVILNVFNCVNLLI